MNPKDTGERTEAIALAGLIKLGYRVLMPFGENCRYDFVTEAGGVFQRLQCKTGRLREGVIEFNAYSQKSNGLRHKDGYEGQADAFIVYCYETDTLYWVPVEDTTPSTMSLRIEAPKINNKRIRWASDYEVRQKY